MNAEEFLRELSCALTPKSPPIDPGDLAAVIRAILSYEKAGPNKVAEVTRRVMELVDKHRGVAGFDEGEIAAHGYILAAQYVFDLEQAEPSIVRLILRAQAAKRSRSHANVVAVVAGLDEFKRVIPADRRSRWRIGWSEKLFVPPPTEPTLGDILGAVETQGRQLHCGQSTSTSSASTLVRAATLDRSPGSAATYRDAVKTWLREPTAKDRELLRAAASRLPFPTRIVADEVDRNYAEKEIKRYFGLEVPLPLATMPVPAATVVATLRSEYPWMSEAIAAIELDLAVCATFGKGAPRLSPLVLLGPPGSGKTSFSRRVSELLGLPSALVSAGGSASSKLLTGSTRGWANARPCLVAELCAKHLCANALVIIDEVEKSGGSAQNGILADSLLAFMEPTSARAFFDEFLLANCDTTAVTWLATANSLKGISAPLLSRMNVVANGQPQAEHMSAIVRTSLASLRAEYQLSPETELLDQQARVEIEMLAPVCISARACYQMVRDKVGQSLRRGLEVETRPALAAATF